MSFDDFIKKYKDKFVEAGGTPDAENQCVDLVNQYIDEVLNLPKILWTDAVDFPSKAGDKYEYIKNTPTGIPQKGDLVIWSLGDQGHIAIFIEGDTNRFTSFDENFPVGSPAHIQEHNYDTPQVIGWLHPKIQNITCDPNWRIERDKNWNLYQGQIEENKKLTERISTLEQEGRDKDETITNFTEKIRILTEENAKYLDIAKKCTDEDTSVAEELSDAQKEKQGLNDDLSAIKAILGLPDASGRLPVIDAINKLKIPHDEIVKHTTKTMNGMFENLTKRRVKWLELTKNLVLLKLNQAGQQLVQLLGKYLK